MPSQRARPGDSTYQSSADDHAWSVLAHEAAATFGTPCYLSRWRPVVSQVEALERRVGPFARSWLSFKTHPLPHLAAAWIRSGRGVEVVSEAEFATVRTLGCPTDRLLVNGVAKHAWLRGVVAPALRVHLDSVAEADALLPQAVQQSWRIGLRCHVPPERDGRDPRFSGQFGLSDEDLRHVCSAMRAVGVAVEGVHFHLGQTRRSNSAYGEAIDAVVSRCLANGVAPRYLDCGGGIDSAPDIDVAVDDLMRAFARAQRALPSVQELWLENGRYITRSSAALIVKVLDTKERAECRYLICDGGRTNQALDADNGAHAVLAVPPRSGAPVMTTISGPTCMTDDRLARMPLSCSLAAGDLIVWLDAGAYHLSWETRFSHGLCAVVWADEHEHLSLARRRETAAEWSALWTPAA
jgi:diaminopimelate decarboxylase